MNAIIVTIGEELLIGQVIDTNSAWMAQELNLLGIKVIERLTITDAKESIKDALDISISKADLVFLTGGLGPTKDDITKQTLASYFNAELVINNDVLEHVREIMRRYKVGMNELNRKQALVPDNCTVLFNEAGTAPGMLFETDGKMIFSMPGVPTEMEYIFTNRIQPILKNKSSQVIIHRTFHTIGIGESNMAIMLEDWENNLPKEIALAYLPSFGKLRLRMSAYGTSEEELNKLLQNEQEKLEKLLGEAIFAYDDETLEESIGKLLKNKGLSISTAESCTGGNIARTLASIAGASDYFMGSVVAYSNDVKSNLLGVSTETLKEHGAVSSQTVEQMALGANKLLNTDIAVSVSGIAGPGGGTKEKPVGTIWIAVAFRDKKVISEVFKYRGNREFNIERTTVAALNMIRKFILTEFS